MSSVRRIDLLLRPRRFSYAAAPSGGEKESGFNCQRRFSVHRHIRARDTNPPESPISVHGVLCSPTTGGTPQTLLQLVAHRMTAFDPLPHRDASATIRGFVYQTNLTIQRWLALRENETLELESGEDIDTVARDFASGVEEERILEQIKNLTAPLTLRSALESVANFALHRERNPNIRLRFRFTTTSSVGRERGSAFPSREPGIVVWQRLWNHETGEAARGEAASALRAFYAGLEQPNSTGAEAWTALRRVIEEASDEQWIDFLTSFEWSTGSGQLAIVDAAIRDELVRLGFAGDNEIATTQHTILFVYVIRLLATNGEKRLIYPEIANILTGPRDRALERRVGSLFERVARVESRVDVIETRVSDIELSQQTSSFEIARLTQRTSRSVCSISMACGYVARARIATRRHRSPRHCHPAIFDLQPNGAATSCWRNGSWEPAVWIATR